MSLPVPAAVATPAPHHFSLPQLQAILSALLTTISILAMLGAAALLVPKAILVAKLRFAERRAATAETALGDVATGLSTLRGELAALRMEVGELRKTQVVSTRYIAQLVLFIRSRRPAADMPGLPPEISDAVLEELRARDPYESHPEPTPA